MSLEDKSRGIQSLEQGYFILNKISEFNRALTIKEIAEICDMPKSKLHRYLTSLRRLGLLEKDKNLRYTLGSGLLLLGLKASQRFDMNTEIEKCLTNLNQRLNETITLAIWGENGPFFYKMKESQKPLNIGVVVGSQISMTKAASGKVFTAFMPEHKTKLLVDEEIKKYQLDKTVFMNEIASIKKQGYATTIGDVYLGISAVAVPIFKHKELVAVITVIGLAELLDISDSSSLIQILKHTSLELSQKLDGEQQCLL